MRRRKRQLNFKFCSVLFHNLAPLFYINILVCMNYDVHHTVMSCLEYDSFLLELCRSYVFYSISIASIALAEMAHCEITHNLTSFYYC